MFIYCNYLEKKKGKKEKTVPQLTLAQSYPLLSLENSHLFLLHCMECDLEQHSE